MNILGCLQKVSDRIESYIYICSYKITQLLLPKFQIVFPSPSSAPFLPGYRWDNNDNGSICWASVIL